VSSANDPSINSMERTSRSLRAGSLTVEAPTARAPESRGLVNTNWADWVGLIISISAAAIAFAAWRSQSEPEVVVYAVPDLSRPSFVNLVIENMGRGIARDVRFAVNQPVPHKAFGMKPEGPAAQPMTAGPLIRGISFMHPGERRIITWGQYHGLARSLVGMLEVRATYWFKSSYWLLRKTSTTLSVIDIESFQYSDVSDRNWDKKAAEALTKIAEHLDCIVDGPTGAIRVRELD
jgi:hypothetical protein